MQLIRMGQKMSSFQVEIAKKKDSSSRNYRYHELHLLDSEAFRSHKNDATNLPAEGKVIGLEALLSKSAHLTE